MAKKVLKKLPKVPKMPKMDLENIIIIVLVIILVALVIVYITKKNENFYGGNSDAKLMFFYADWCGYCQKAKPEIEKLVDELKKRDNKVKGKSVTVQYVNGDEESELCSNFNIDGFPTMIFVNGASNKTYEGPRESESILSFIEDQC